MQSKATYKDLIFIFVIILLGLIVLHLFFRKDVQVLPVPTEKVIVKRIEQAKGEVNNYETIVQTDKKLVQELGGQIDNLFAELESLKNKRDTFKIIQKQDTLIGVLVKQSIVKDSVISGLDKMVFLQKGIIRDQDTVILLKDAKIKKLKRQRNISILTNGLLLTLLIIK